MEQFKLKVGRCFALISNHLGDFDLLVTGRRHFLLSARSLSFNNVMITLTPGVLSSAFSLNASARQGACKRSLFKSIGVSPENQRWLPKQ